MVSLVANSQDELRTNRLLRRCINNQTIAKYLLTLIYHIRKWLTLLTILNICDSLDINIRRVKDYLSEGRHCSHLKVNIATDDPVEEVHTEVEGDVLRLYLVGIRVRALVSALEQGVSRESRLFR